MSKTLAIIGCGDLGLQIARFAIEDRHYSKVIFFDDFFKGKKIKEYAVAGPTKMLDQGYKNGLFDELIIGIGYNHLQAKQEFYDFYEESIPFGTIIHSSCWVDKTAQIKKGSVIYPGCCIDAEVCIEENTLLNLSCTIAHNSIIGKHSFLSPRVAVSGFVTIRQKCNIGVNTTIIDNISVSDNIRTGGGAVVIKNLEQPGLYVGNPARFIK